MFSKFMSAIALMLCFTVFMNNVNAEELDMSNLTPQQRHNLQVKAAEMAAANAKSQVVVQQPKPTTITEDVADASAAMRKELTEWGFMGKGVGVALIAAAKEVGIAANEFAQTDLGKVTVAIVAYKMIGNEALDLLNTFMGIAVGSFILLFSFGLAVWVLYSSRFHYKVEYEQVPYFWGLFQVSKVKSAIAEEEENRGMRLVFAVVVIIIGLIVGLNCIF